MSERTVDGTTATTTRDGTLDLRARVPGGVTGWRRRVTVAAALLALLPTAARVAVNAPGTLPVDLAAAGDALGALGLLGPGLAAVVLGATEQDALVGVGLLFVGVFALLAGLAPDALVPAAVAMPAGAGLAILAAARRRRVEGTADRRPRPAHLAVAAVLLAGVLVALAGALGVAAGTLRPAGSSLALLGAGATPVFVPTASRDWLVGGVAAAGVVTAAAAAPFVLGAVLLVGLGVVGTPLLVVAVGIGGLAVAASAAARHRTWTGLAAVGLLLAGGVAGSAGGAAAVCLAAVVLARGGVALPVREANDGTPRAANGGEVA